MKKFVRYMCRPDSRQVEKFVFDSFEKAHKFECSKLYAGWSGVCGPDFPQEIDLPVYEQLRLF